MTNPDTQMNGQSLNIAEQRRKELEQLFPGIFTETRNDKGELKVTIDVERLKAELGEFTDIYDSRRERYGMDWPGKRDSLTPEQIKKLSVIHREQDRMSGVKSIEFIQDVRPVLIIDEPQSVDNTTKARRAINHLKPLFALRYSATHRNPYNVVYQLGPVKAYDMKLVKQISVASIPSQSNVNQTYLKLANYRYYDEHGAVQKGKIARWFEEAYCDLAASPLFSDLPKRGVEQVHNGYFAEVKKRGKVVELKDTSGNTASDGEVYELIMKDKERLLDDAEPLRFIFSHSALKEGWDNPNVFQICTLREFGSEKERRQTLGRGLRLSVDANGDRAYNPQINRLTVVASESFEEYAKNLQTEMEKDIGGGFKFGRVPAIAFAPLAINDTETLGQEKSRHLQQAG